jgi:release factor glutamine methyltransferase
MTVEGHATAIPSPASTPLESSDGLGEVSESLTGAELLRWRRELSSWGGEPGALDWLLDASGGLSFSRQRCLSFHPGQMASLRLSRMELADLWRQHLDTGIPLQYLVGHCYWRDFSLDVGPAVLIPRPETELVVDLILDLLRDKEDPIPAPPDLLWADLGTGSGCLAMGLAHALPHSHGLAVDVSPAALAVARRNLGRAGLHKRVRLIEGDWLEALQPWWGALSVVVANPPYIPSAVVDHLDPLVRDHEPRLALDGGTDGLASLREIARLAPRALADGGCLLLEHHHDQSQAVIDLLAQHGLVDLRSHRDLEGHLRFVSGRFFVASSPFAGRGRS